MQLTIVVALICFLQTALCAPAVNLKSTRKEDDRSKFVRYDALERELEKQPILTQHENEAEHGPISGEAAAENEAGPEVKRSERVDVDDEPADADEDKLQDLSGNLNAADQDVKAVLKTFFANLKQHPEIVEDIIEREGAKLMDHPLDVGTAGDGIVPLDLSDFRQPSPQLLKSPKQIEKKAGLEYPRFIYKSPMRNTEERNQLTSRSQNNQGPPSQPNDDEEEHNDIVDNGNAHRVDMSNAIPVIQQPSSNQEAEEEQVNELLSNPDGGAIDLASLQRAQEEYSKEHPFVNTLPLFPDQLDYTANSEDIVKSEEKPVEVHEEPEPKADDNEIVNTYTEPESTVDSDREDEHGEKKSDEVDETETETESNSHEEDAQSEHGTWSETQVDDESKTPHEVAPHKMTEDEIIPDELLNNPVEQESSVTLRPYSYYYYYNENGDNEDGGELDAAEEGEESDENQLQKISDEASKSEEEEDMSRENEANDNKSEEVEEEKETEEEDDSIKSQADDSNESQTDDSSERQAADSNESQTDDSSESQADDSSESQADDSSESQADDSSEIQADDTEDVEEEEGDHDESEEVEHTNNDKTIELEAIKESEKPMPADNTNSENVEVEESVIIADPENPGVPRLFKSKGMMVDKDEADLMSLHGNEQHQPANRPIVGQPM